MFNRAVIVRYRIHLRTSSNHRVRQPRHQIPLFLGNDRKKKYVLECSRPDQDRLVIDGKLGEDALTVRIKRMDPSFSRRR